MSFKKFKPYPKYKDSGVEWLGEVPAHWEVKRLKFLGQAIIGLTYDPSEVANEGDGILVLRSSNIQGGQIVFDDNLFVRKAVPEKILTKLGDILICSRNGSRALIGKNAVINDDSVGFTFGAFMTIFRSKHNPYLSYVFNSSLFEFQSGSFLTSTVNQLTTSNLYSFEVPVPPNGEQFAIPSFLDQETSRIDTLISEKERLISLLQEYRQALISNAVTKGLDPNVKIKDSGVKWLGIVPEHWEVLKLKYLATICGGGTPSKLKQEFWEGDIPWVSPKDLKSNAIEDTEDHITKEAVLESSTQIIPSQTVLIVVRSGILQHTIPIAINTVPVALNQDMKAILFNEMINPLYFLYLVTGLTSLLLLEWRKKGPTVESIESEYLSNTLIPVPPIFEQNSIIATLLKKTSRIDTLISEARKFIDLLKEYRSSLITAAVTGKIDVREVVPSGSEKREIAHE